MATYGNRDRAAALAAPRGLVAGCNVHRPAAQVPAGIFGLGHGGGAHAPNEYWGIESSNPKVAGMDGSSRSFVDLFYSLA